jgi:hypothetical protein
VTIVIFDNESIAFNASKAVYVGKEKYLYGTVNNRTGWIAAKDLEHHINIFLYQHILLLKH